MTDVSMRIERAVATDAASLSRLAADTFTEKFGHLYTPENLQVFLDKNHSVQWYKEAIARDDMAIWLIRDKGEELLAYGVAGANTLPVDEGTSPTGEIKRIYIRDTYQGQGIGGRMLASMMAWMRARKNKTLYVGVYSDNLGAQNLYSRLGFSKIGEYLFSVGAHDDLEFILMRTTLPDDPALHDLEQTQWPESLSVTRHAFGQEDEAELVTRLRGDGDMLHEVVVKRGDQILGHAALSRLMITSADSTIEAAALAPVSVLPDAQGKGIGLLLCEALLNWWQQNGNGVCVVLGHPGYYPRFGFNAEAACTHLVSPFPEVGDAFMLSDPKGELKDVTGATLHYAAAFNID